MALVGTDQEEDERPMSSSSPNAVAATSAAQGLPQNSGGGFAGGTGSGSGQGATTGAAQTQQAQQPGGGGYANLIQYLGANQDSGAKVGQAAESVVDNSANAATKAQNDYSTSAQGDISNAASTLGVDQNVLNQINSGAPTANAAELAKITAGGNSTTGKYTGPTSENVVYNAPSVGVNYGGPNDTGSFTGQTAANQAGALGAQGVLAGNVKNANGGMPGVSALLSNVYNQPGYTQGEKGLDSFLAGGTTGGAQALGQATGTQQNVSDSYAGINKMLTDQIAGAQGQAANTNQTYQNAISTAQGNVGNVQKQYDDAIAAAQAKAAAYKAPTQGTSLGLASSPASSGSLDYAWSPQVAYTPQVGQLSIDLPSSQRPAMPTNVFNRTLTPQQKANSATIANAAKQRHGQDITYAFSHGGEVPSYSKLIRMLK